MNEEKTGLGDVIRMESQSGKKDYFLIVEDLNAHDENDHTKLQIAPLTDFEDLEYHLPQYGSNNYKQFQEGNYKTVGHITQYTNLRTKEVQP